MDFFFLALVLDLRLLNAQLQIVLNHVELTSKFISRLHISTTISPRSHVRVTTFTFSITTFAITLMSILRVPHGHDYEQTGYCESSREGEAKPIGYPGESDTGHVGSSRGQRLVAISLGPVVQAGHTAHGDGDGDGDEEGSWIVPLVRA